MNEILGVFLLIITLMICLFLYMLPTLISYYNKDKNTAWIFVLNLLLGWSTIGWIVALIWAVIERNGDDLIQGIRNKL